MFIIFWVSHDFSSLGVVLQCCRVVHASGNSQSFQHSIHYFEIFAFNS